ncbi:MAG: glycosyl transferase, partial [Acidobacteriaceae bacterium]
MPVNSGNQPGKPPKNLRLLIVRLGAMGDILHSMPAVTALRREHPEWMIGWAIEPQWRGLFASNDGKMPLVDQVHIVPAKRWAKSPLNPATLR